MINRIFLDIGQFRHMKRFYIKHHLMERCCILCYHFLPHHLDPKDLGICRKFANGSNDVMQT